jgi:CPA2 family monovalent cation:H+ antiporter-2
MESPHGRAGLGVLLFQDLALAPMLAVVPVLAGAVGEGAVGQFLVRFLGSAAVLAAVFLVARFVVPGLLGRLVATRMREIFILGAVAICLGMALFTVELGFSAALGAFLAGVILAESDFSHQLEADVAPFRDVFTSFFFVSIGMLLDLRAAIERWDAVLAFTAAALLVKALVAVGAFRVAGLALRPAVTAGVGLAQIGEFSFVLAMAGRAAGVLSPERYQVVVAAAVLTLLATPLLIAGGPGLGRWASRRWGELPASQPEVEALADHVVLVGFGLNGRNLALVLDEARIPWIGLDLDRHRVRAAREAGAPLHFGDATRREILELARIGTARALVVAISDPDALRRVVRLARQLGPRLWILVRSRELAELDTLVREGANEVVAEELESSIEIAVRVLQRYHVPRNVIDAEVRALRAGSYEMLRGASPVGVVTASLLAALERGTTDVFRVEQDSAAAGRTLAELDLRRATGASVLAVVRGGTGRANPNPDLVLAAGDELVLVGGHAEIEAAWQRLRGESP